MLIEHVAGARAGVVIEVIASGLDHAEDEASDLGF